MDRRTHAMRSICLSLALFGMAAVGLATFGSTARAEDDEVKCKGPACRELDIQYRPSHLIVTLKKESNRKVRLEWTARPAERTCEKGVRNIFFVGGPTRRQEYTDSFSCGPLEADYTD
jgi:hypothetical protein